MIHSFLSKQQTIVVHNTDVADRDKVLTILREEFGETNVAAISNYNTLQLKILLKDLAKFYGIPFEEANAATKTVEQDVRQATTKHGDDKNLFVLKYKDAIEHSPTFKAFIDKHPEVGKSIESLFEQNRSLGKHAGGVLISDDLPKKMPLIRNKGELQSPWVEGTKRKQLEYIGEFIKLDLLGLETIRLIERTIELILSRRGGIICLEIEGKQYRVAAQDKVKLSDGSYRLAKLLTTDDDVLLPLKIEH